MRWSYLKHKPPPLPTKAYTTLVPKFENTPFSRILEEKNLFQPTSLILRHNKTPLFKQNTIFS